MSFNRIQISQDATYRIRQLKGRTGLRPNILCRFALLYSLNEPRIPNPVDSDKDGMEFNRYTLTGEWDSFFIALLKERCIQDGLDPAKDILSQFIAHLNRGILSIFSMVRDLGDFRNLIPADILNQTLQKEIKPNEQ